MKINKLTEDKVIEPQGSRTIIFNISKQKTKEHEEYCTAKARTGDALINKKFYHQNFLKKSNEIL